MRMSVLATALVLGGVAASTAQAMPSPAPIDAAKTSQIVNVDYACGRGWHATPWGHCRPNRYAPPPRRDWERRGPPPGWYGYRTDPYARPHYQGWYRPPPRW
ncbi:GCG_CRPN prefix-to-repeats domain-containing protein [Rhizobium sp. RAF56]|jgi:hypothetical protein|uniref:GCG_CRPN prefix-to-repeats domain-containing protein n=1 Tax=Rhizobium sp. RAF56 TaxID=3233062 RepID=UPI003F9B7238